MSRFGKGIGLAAAILCIAGAAHAAGPWPCTLDRLYRAGAYSTAGGMGQSMAIDEPYVLVGASDEKCTNQPGPGPTCGAAYMFRFAIGITTSQRLARPTPVENCRFGAAVDVDGNYAVVGAPRGLGTGVAAANIFRLEGGVWNWVTALTSDDPLTFGTSVAVSGTTIAVGAPGAICAGGSFCGSVTIYGLSGSVWTPQAVLNASDAFPGGGFGRSAALDGDRLVVGAAADSCTVPSPGCGNVYVFERSGGAWTERARIQPGLPELGDDFGLSLALEGDLIVVGAPSRDCPAGGRCGAAFVFRFDGASWVEEDQLSASDAGGTGSFGWSVAVSGDLIVVGAPGHACTGGTDCGAAYLFQRQDGAWNETFRLLDRFGESLDALGVSVAVSATRVVAASQKADGLTVPIDEGALLVFPPDVVDCDGNGNPDGCDLDAGIAEDCNGNLVLDSCDIGAGTSADCNLNGVPDDCVSGGYEVDCNANQTPDDCDLSSGTSQDCNNNGIPDECLGGGNEVDCNGNLAPDPCDIAAGTSEDCNATGIPDECEAPQADCNGNAIADGCDLRDGASEDCNANGVPDECEPPLADCNGNSIADGCDIRDGASRDCDGNGVPDECEPDADCNNNQQLDRCDLASGASRDCNDNSTPDECDIASGTSQDQDADGWPDECCQPLAAPEPELIDLNPSSSTTVLGPNRKGRYLSFAAGEPGRAVKVRVTFRQLPPPWDGWNGTAMWLMEPQLACELASLGQTAPCPSGQPTWWLAALTCDIAEAHAGDWTTYGIVHITHAGIIPSNRVGTPSDAVYDIQTLDVECNPDNEGHYSDPLVIVNPRWGDLSGSFDTGSFTYVGPDGTVGITTDVVAALNKFSNRPGSPAKTRCDVEPAAVDQKINLADVTRVLDGFRGLPYPFQPGQLPCR